MFTDGLASFKSVSDTASCSTSNKKERCVTIQDSFNKHYGQTNVNTGQGTGGKTMETNKERVARTGKIKLNHNETKHNHYSKRVHFMSIYSRLISDILFTKLT